MNPKVNDLQSSFSNFDMISFSVDVFLAVNKSAGNNINLLHANTEMN